MLDVLFTRRAVSERLRAGLFGPWLERFAEGLCKQGYSPNGIRTFVYASDKFGRWMTRHGHGVDDVTPALVRRYVEELRRTRRTRRPKAACGVSLLLELLRQEGLVREPLARPQTDADRWLARYDAHLERVLGAAWNTRDRYETIVRRFLRERFGAGTVDWASLTAEDVSTFVCREARGRRGAGRKQPAVAVRSLLRFLVFSGEVAAGLDAAIPKVPHRQHATLPRHLTAEQVASLLASCEGMATGARDRAVMLLLARLGLRAGEVVNLHLDDVDWREGQLRIRAAKTQRERQLPLTAEVGEALVAYLRERRAAGPHRQIFLSARPPFAPFTGPTGVGRLVRRACRRAGFPRELEVGAHALRHAAATHMVCQGVSFKAVADVLGHQSLQTTAIYAKLDLAALAQVALPWPEAAP